ncbi:MAG TPA: hypothetical protein VFV38_21500 [Ktedonobacteraceae bacterium]|nr:hypothetical protein [Ktedonobacteraceae bacterium]
MDEVARIREQIDREIAAMRQAQAYASVARHEMIVHRYDNLTRCFEDLSAKVGSMQAIAEIANKMEADL